MQKFPLKLEKSLELRKNQSAFRQLGKFSELVDFCSNDYLGFSGNHEIYEHAQKILMQQEFQRNGGGGSRLLSGNHGLYPLAEEKLRSFFNSEEALIYNSGYDANVGFFASVPQRGDFILFDEFSHASIRDGIRLSHAKAYKFIHNSLEDLEKQIKRIRENNGETLIYIVTEAVFSMDGDSPALVEMARLSQKYDCYLIIDEAHSVGVIGDAGKGLVEELKIEEQVFARLITFGKALGAHGSAILGSNKLKDYLVNFSRSLIYTTSLPPHSLATILAAVEYLETKGVGELVKLQKNIEHFNSEVEKRDLQELFILGTSSIHCCLIPGNEKVKRISSTLKEQGFDIKPILSPTVPKGKERLRFCLHSFNLEEDINSGLTILQKEFSK